MRPSLALNTHREAIRAIALRHRVTNVRVFGSVVHGDDTEGSDLDLLVDPTQETTLMDIARIQLELSQLLPVAVDVLTPNGLPAKFRDQVIAQAHPQCVSLAHSACASCAFDSGHCATSAVIPSSHLPARLARRNADRIPIPPDDPVGDR